MLSFIKTRDCRRFSGIIRPRPPVCALTTPEPSPATADNHCGAKRMLYADHSPEQMRDFIGWIELNLIVYDLYSQPLVED